MPDKEQATKLLGFRDDKGALVCPAEVVDPSKFHTFHVGAEDGSYTPTEAELKTIGDLLEQVGLKGQTTKVKGNGGTTFYNKKGVIICRVVEGKAAPEPKKVAPEPEPAPEPIEPEKPKSEDVTAKVEPPKVEEKATASAKASVKVEKAPVKKTPVKKGRGRK